jgi:hypothetical protein
MSILPIERNAESGVFGACQIIRGYLESQTAGAIKTHAQFLYHARQYRCDIHAFDPHNAFFRLSVAQQVDAAVPDKAIVYQDNFLVDIGFLDNRDGGLQICDTFFDGLRYPV